MSLANLELVIHAQIFTSRNYLMRFFCLFQQAGRVFWMRILSIVSAESDFATPLPSTGRWVIVHETIRASTGVP